MESSYLHTTFVGDVVLFQDWTVSSGWGVVLVCLFLLVLAFAQEAIDAHQQKLYHQPAWRPSIQTYSRHGTVHIPAIMMIPYAAGVTFTGKLIGLFLMLIAMSFNIVLILLVAFSVTVAKMSFQYPRPTFSMNVLRHTEDQPKQVSLQMNNDTEQAI